MLRSHASASHRSLASALHLLVLSPCCLSVMYAVHAHVCQNRACLPLAVYRGYDRVFGMALRPLTII
jgi:hypothetical protein